MRAETDQPEKKRRTSMESHVTEEGELTAEDVRLLSEWVADGTDDSDSERQLFLEVPDDDLSLENSPEAPRRKRKKRPSYLRTRDAKEGLQDEIAELEARLAVLKKRAGLEEEQASVEQTAVQNAVLRGVVHQQHMVMATTHSLLVRRLNEQATHPLYTPVHLGKDWQSRRRTLESMRAMKLRKASQYLMERSMELDELQTHISQEVTQDADGNLVCSQFEIVQFSNARSLREVYEATIHFYVHEEIVLSERMGYLAIQDDFDTVDGVAANKRMYWIDDNGITTEWNSVSFGKLLDEEYAVLAIDSVDEDERYPFQPATRVRRDWSGGILLSVAKKNDDGSMVVVMRRAAITKLHLPTTPLTSEMKDSLVKSIFIWSEVMLASIRSQLSLSSSAAQPASRAVEIESV